MKTMPQQSHSRIIRYLVGSVTSSLILTIMLGCSSQLPIFVRSDYIHNQLRPPRPIDSHVDIYPEGFSLKNAQILGTVKLEIGGRSCVQELPFMREWLISKARQMGGDGIANLQVDTCTEISSTATRLPGYYATVSTTAATGLRSLTATVIGTEPQKMSERSDISMVGVWDIAAESGIPTGELVKIKEQHQNHFLGVFKSSDDECVVNGFIGNAGIILISPLKCEKEEPYSSVYNFILQLKDKSTMEGYIATFRLPGSENRPFVKKYTFTRRSN